VLGASLVAGGRGRIDRYSSFLSFGLIAFATLLFLVPSIPAWDGSDPDTDSLAQVSAAISIVRLLVYAAVAMTVISGVIYFIDVRKTLGEVSEAAEDAKRNAEPDAAG